jgi:hypothetical protein
MITPCGRQYQDAGHDPAGNTNCPRMNVEGDCSYEEGGKQHKTRSVHPGMAEPKGVDRSLWTD